MLDGYGHDLKPYPEYRDSGLPWLGRIPSHWEVRRNGRLFAQRNETGCGDLPILEVSLKTGVRVRNMDDLKRKQVMADREKYKRAARGDIAYNMMRMWQGAVGVSPEDGLVSPAYVVARPYPEAEPRFFSYLFRTDAYKNEVDGYSRGIVKDRNRLYWEDFKRMPSCLPPLDEQKVIADYLDANAAKVRRFIRNRRRLIEVLNEQKQAIINRAVTRGLDPNVPLRPSGIDWLGDIPEHWDVRRNKLIFCERIESGTDGMPLLVVSLRTGVTIGEEVDGRGRPKRLIEDRAKYKRACIGDLAYNMMRLWQGAVGTVPVDGLVSPAYVVAKPIREVVPHFFEHLLRTPGYMGSVNRESRGIVSDRNRTYWDNFKQLSSPFPPVDEQADIVEFIDAETRSFCDSTTLATREIELVREYRTRLIADVVTGKVDVRHLPEALGDESVEPEELSGSIEDDEIQTDDEPQLAGEVES
ncbi:MAG: restriction endonuclease subunit S [Phycisphaerales bacterium]